MVNNGTVPGERLDDMVTRIMAAYYKLGQNNNYPEVNFNCAPLIWTSLSLAHITCV